MAEKTKSEQLRALREAQVTRYEKMGKRVVKVVVNKKKPVAKQVGRGR